MIWSYAVFAVFVLFPNEIGQIIREESFLLIPPCLSSYLTP